MGWERVARSQMLKRNSHDSWAFSGSPKAVHEKEETKNTKLCSPHAEQLFCFLQQNSRPGSVSFLGAMHVPITKHTYNYIAGPSFGMQEIIQEPACKELADAVRDAGEIEENRQPSLAGSPPQGQLGAEGSEQILHCLPLPISLQQQSSVKHFFFDSTQALHPISFVYSPHGRGLLCLGLFLHCEHKNLFDVPDIKYTVRASEWSRKQDSLLLKKLHWQE